MTCGFLAVAVPILRSRCKNPRGVVERREVAGREKEKLEKTLGGIRGMGRVPNAVWIVDTKKEHLAVDEARKLGLDV